MGLDTAPYESEIAAIATRLAQLPDARLRQKRVRDSYFAARRAVRKLAFANPLLQFNQLLFVKRFTQQTYPDICLNHMPWVSRPGGDLCVLDSPFSATAAAESPVRRSSWPASSDRATCTGWICGGTPVESFLDMPARSLSTRRFSRGRRRR